MIHTIVKKLSSVKLAATLIFVMAVLGLLGILLPQIPAAFAASRTGIPGGWKT